MHELTQLQPISAEALAAMGEPSAYVKAVAQDGNTVYAIHADDGRLLAVAQDRDLAFAIIRKNDLEPCDAH